MENTWNFSVTNLYRFQQLVSLGDNVEIDALSCCGTLIRTVHLEGNKEIHRNWTIGPETLKIDRCIDTCSTCCMAFC